MRPIPFILALAVAIAVFSGRAEEDVDTIPAQEAARAWLVAVDAGNYGRSWDTAAEQFQKAVKRDDWEKALVAARSPFGSAGARKSRAVQYVRNPPNAPEGEYVVIQYEAVFESRPAIETVTSMKEKNGTWKVSGYFIR